eukprot:g8924.t1
MAEKLLQNVSRLGGVVALAAATEMCLFNVDGGQRAVIFDRFQGVKEAVVGEGTHFMIPVVQKPIIIDVRARPRTINSITGTKDLQMANISLRVLSRPLEAELPRIYQELGTDFDDRVLPSLGNEVLKAVVAKYNAEELLSKRESVSTRIRDELTHRAKQFHLIMDDVSITHLTFGHEFTKAIENKQVAQQEAERQVYVVALSDQERLAAIIRAEGEAEAAELISSALKESGIGLIEESWQFQLSGCQFQCSPPRNYRHWWDSVSKKFSPAFLGWPGREDGVRAREQLAREIFGEAVQNRPRRSRRLSGSSAVPSAAASTGTPTDGASFPSDQRDGGPVLSSAYSEPDRTRERPLIIDEASPGSGFGEGGDGGGGQEVDARWDTHRPGSGGGGGGDKREEREPGARAGANGSSPGDGDDDATHAGSPRAQVCGWQGQIPHSAVANERAGAVASPGTVTGTGGAGTVRPGHGNLAWKAVKIGNARATYVVTERGGALASDGGPGVVPVLVNVNDAAGPAKTVTRGRPLHAEFETKLLRALLHDGKYAHLRRISGVEAGHVDVGAVERAASRHGAIGFETRQGSGDGGGESDISRTAATHVRGVASAGDRSGATGAASGGGGAGASGRAIPSKGKGKGEGKGKRTRGIAEDGEEGGLNVNLNDGGGGSVDPGAAATHIQTAAAAAAGQDDHDVLLGCGPERTRDGGSSGGGGGGKRGPEGGATRVQKALSASNDGSTIARSSGPAHTDPKKKGRTARTGNGQLLGRSSIICTCKEGTAGF